MTEVIDDLPFADYQARPEVNNSSLHDLDEDRRDAGCPAKYYHNHVLKLKDHSHAETPALSFGRALHSFCLTPKVFLDEYVIENDELYQRILAEANEEQIANKRKPSPKFSKSLGAWKAYTKQVKETGKELLDQKSYKQIIEMTEHIKDPEKALDQRTPKIFEKDLQYELSCFASLDDGRGNLVDCKARLDAFDEGNPEPNAVATIYDLKSLAEWNPGKSIASWGWWVQAAFYADIAKACGLCSNTPRFAWIFTKKTAPYESQLHFAEPALIKAGRLCYQGHLQTIVDCRKSGEWGGHGPVTYPHSLNQILELI
tara:strand:- start:277 stop:1218 length:942 start_codon:yes stop_codon:yes gene_type:complete